jgi:hypothetical protein
MKLSNVINIILAAALSAAIVIAVDLWGELQEAWTMMSPSGECQAEIVVKWPDDLEVNCSWNGKFVNVEPLICSP